MSSSIHLANLSNVQAEQSSRFHCQKTPCGATTRADVISKMPGTTESIVAAPGAVFTPSYVVALRTVCSTSIAFGGIGAICCCLSKAIGPKMNHKE
jgi:hypothetical protein